MFRKIFFCVVFLVVTPLVAAPIAAHGKSYDVPASSLYKRFNNEDYIGDSSPKVTVITYDSMSCPHCASFAVEVMPKLIEKYENGVMFIKRDFPLDGPSLRASALVKCMGRIKGGTARIMLMDAQKSWVFSEKDALANNIYKVVKPLGMSLPEVKECMNNEDIIEEIMQVRNLAAEKLRVSATPVQFINGKKIDGMQNIESMVKYIDEAMEQIKKEEM